MISSIQSIRNHLLAIVFTMACASSLVTAAPVVYENSPLFLSNRAEPNLFFVMDDSGSMNTDIMSPFESVAGWGGVITLSQAGNDWFYLYLFGSGTDAFATTLGNVNQNYLVIPHFSGIYDVPDTQTTTPVSTIYTTPNASFNGVWRARNYRYNPLYYNPNVDYSPWAGVDNTGTQYADITDGVTFPAAVNAPFNPYNPGSTFNLVGNQNFQAYIRTAADTGAFSGGNFITYTYYPAFYNVWFDTDGDGNIEDTDDFRRIEIRSTSTQCSGTGDDADQYTNGCIKRTPAKEIQNFANWFAYHRKRESVAKYGTSQVVNTSSNLRMGYTTINMRHNTTPNVSVRLDTMNPDPSTGNKKTLLDNLYQTVFNNGTPLNRGLELTGEYFDCTQNQATAFANNDTNCAIQQTPIAPATEAAGICQQNYTILVTDGEYTDSASLSVNNEDSTGSITSIFDGGPYSDTLSDTLADLTMHFYEKDLSGLANQVPIECGVDENPAQHMVSYILGFGVTGTLDASTFQQPSGFDASCPSTTVTAPSWPTAIASFANRIDDVAHAAYNGRGQYLSAQNPKDLTDGLNSVLSDVIKRTGSASAVTINTSSLNTGSVAFFASFNSAFWNGEFSAYPIDSNGNIDLASPLWPGGAHGLLEARAPSDRTILTFNDNSASYGAIPFRTFASLTTQQQNDLSTDTNGNLVSDPVAAQARLDFIRGDHTCEVDYLPSSDCIMGATSRIFRSRVIDPVTKERFKLGDIIHSSPVYVTTPPQSYPGSDPFGIDGARYRDFRNGVTTASAAFSSTNDATNRTPMVYIGGNDGMLHAFDASVGNPTSGKEIWAYIPNSLFQSDELYGPGLHKLTEIDYEHQYYVDLTPTVADAYIDPDGVGGPNWHTILVGGLRAGGRGLFAIDVTDPDFIINSASPETDLATKVMWEFSSNDDKDFGLTYGEPRIVPMGNSSSIDWYVIVGNGYNSLSGNKDIPVAEESVKPVNVTGATRNPYSSKLFILKLSGPGSDGQWDHGTDYWKIDTKLPAGNTWTEADRNGLSGPAVADSDGDSIADLVYAGDLDGRLWAFDITGNNSNAWNIYGGGSPIPLFTATDSSGIFQPITSAPSLAFNADVETVTSPPSSANTPNLLVFFGTGTYLKPTDIGDTSEQSFYGIWDNGESNIPSGGYYVDRADAATDGSSSVVQQTIVTDTVNSGTQTVRSISPPNNVNYAGGNDFGWFMDLPTSGERVNLTPIAISNLVFFKTLIPSPNPCDFGGTSWNMFVDATTGQNPDQSLLDFDGNGSIGTGDLTAGGNVASGVATSAAITNSSLVNTGSGSGGGLSCPAGYDKKAEIITLSNGSTSTSFYCIPEGAKTGRFSWRELNF